MWMRVYEVLADVLRVLTCQPLAGAPRDPVVRRRPSRRDR